MAGLREQRKQRTRRAILRSAGQHFATHGYAATTTAQIADGAGIAEGTVFNYFPTKAAILVAWAASAFQAESGQSDVGLYELRPVGREGLAAELVRMLDHHLAGAQEMDRDLLAELLSTALRPTAEGRFVLRSLFDMDAASGVEIGRWLQQEVDAGVIDPVADLEAFLQIGYAVVTLGFTTFVVSDSMTYEAFIGWLRLRLEQLVEAMLPGPPSSANRLAEHAGGR